MLERIPRRGKTLSRVRRLPQIQRKSPATMGTRTPLPRLRIRQLKPAPPSSLGRGAACCATACHDVRAITRAILRLAFSAPSALNLFVRRHARKYRTRATRSPPETSRFDYPAPDTPAVRLVRAIRFALPLTRAAGAGRDETI